MFGPRLENRPLSASHPLSRRAITFLAPRPRVRHSSGTERLARRRGVLDAKRSTSFVAVSVSGTSGWSPATIFSMICSEE